MDDRIMAIIGIAGGIICAVADCLLDIKGADNRKLGVKKIIDSKWAEMAPWRFVASDICVMFAVPMYTMGFWALMNQIAESHHTLALAMKIIFSCGAMGGFMIHTFVCLTPGIYRNIMRQSTFELAEKVIMDAFRTITVPFFTLYAMLVIVPSVAVIYMIVAGILPLPIWCAVMNPLVFQVIGLALRATKCKLFIDAPSICAASLGLASYGVLALMI